MKSRPILFSAPMVRAVLAGTKTQTRRAVKGTALEWLGPDGFTPEFVASPENHLCPYGVPGDRLWVRETLKPWTQDPALFAYAADDTLVQGDSMNFPVKPGRPYVPSIHLARCWSRLELEVTGVRVERLQDISEADANAEGVQSIQCGELGAEVPYYRSLFPPRELYRMVWESLGGDWDANPWVWVIEFKRAA